jgi:hypothetical protein
MVNAAVSDAHRAANYVTWFIRHSGLWTSSKNQKPLPANFLLHLGSALQLIAWEAKGISIHRDAGLPDAQQAMRDAFITLNNPAFDPMEFVTAVEGLAVERFSWSSQEELGIDVLLDEPDEEVLLEALADFLWNNLPN